MTTISSKTLSVVNSSDNSLWQLHTKVDKVKPIRCYNNYDISNYINTHVKTIVLTDFPKEHTYKLICNGIFVCSSILVKGYQQFDFSVDAKINRSPFPNITPICDYVRFTCDKVVIKSDTFNLRHLRKPKIEVIGYTSKDKIFTETIMVQPYKLYQAGLNNKIISKIEVTHSTPVSLINDSIEILPADTKEQNNVFDFSQLDVISSKFSLSKGRQTLSECRKYAIGAANKEIMKRFHINVDDITINTSRLPLFMVIDDPSETIVKITYQEIVSVTGERMFAT